MVEELTPEQKARLEEVRRLRYDGIKAAKKLRNDDAEALYWQALRLHERILGMEDSRIAESLNQIIFFYGVQDRRAESEPLIQRSLALLRRKPGPKHRGVLQTLDVLAIRAQRLGHYENATWYYKQVLTAREEFLELNHPRIAATLENYAALLREMGREVEAETLAGRARQIRDLRGSKEKG